MNENCNMIYKAKYNLIKHVITSENRYFVFMLTEPQEGCFCLRLSQRGFSHKCGASIQLWVWSLVRFLQYLSHIGIQPPLTASYRSSSNLRSFKQVLVYALQTKQLLSVPVNAKCQNDPAIHASMHIPQDASRIIC